jgi:hypothetical protein
MTDPANIAFPADKTRAWLCLFLEPGKQHGLRKKGRGTRKLWKDPWP